MSKESLEHLSSLMDGEISRDSGMFLTRRLSSDDKMCETWERYHLIRDCIRQPGGKQLVTGLSEKLNAKLAAEEAPSISAWQNNRWLKPVSGFAIAASVASFAVMVALPQPASLPVNTGNMSQTASVNKPFVSPNTLPLAPSSQAASFSSAGQTQNQRMNSYLLRHNQMARTAGRQGFVSFVPIVVTQKFPDSVAEDDKLNDTELGSEQESTENK
jgi:sigma-E factor negative regulatory protein RseA